MSKLAYDLSVREWFKNESVYAFLKGMILLVLVKINWRLIEVKYSLAIVKKKNSV